MQFLGKDIASPVVLAPMAGVTDAAMRLLCREQGAAWAVSEMLSAKGWIYSQGKNRNAAELLAVRLRERGVKTVMFDVSVTPASEIIAAAFRWSHLVFAAPTYNAGIFVTMENLLHDIANHNLQNRKIAVLENGSWAPTSGKQMREILSTLKKCEFIGENVTIHSSLAEDQLAELDAIADAVAADIADAKQ